jgi:hypothetical protein
MYGATVGLSIKQFNNSSDDIDDGDNKGNDMSSFFNYVWQDCYGEERHSRGVCRTRYKP